MITETLVPELKRRFPNARVRLMPKTGIVAVFPAAHADVGELTIYDDGDEATIEIGKITHLHVNPYSNALTRAQRDHAIASEVLAFLGRLFADRVLLCVYANGMGGGCRDIPDGVEAEGLEAGSKYYLWSGPLKS